MVCLKLRPRSRSRSPRTCRKTCQFMVVWALEGYARLDDGGRMTSCSSSPRKFGKAKPANGAGTQRPESEAVVKSFVLGRPQAARKKSVLIHIYIYIYIYVCMYICMYVYAHTYIHTYIHPSMHACICIYIYIHSCILFCTHHSPTFCEDIVVPHLYHAASRGTEQILEK